MNTETKHIIYLHGSLGERFSKEPITLYVGSIHQAVRGLTCQFGNAFHAAISQGSWHVLSKEEGEEGVEGVDLGDLTLPIPFKTIHIYPELSGSFTAIGTAIAGALSYVGSAVGAVYSGSIAALAGGTVGAGGAITGASAGAISAATFVVNTALTIAASSALSAIITAINSPTINYANTEVEENKSFLYNGVVNTIEQGAPAPIILGRHMIGSIVISVNMESDEIGFQTNIIDDVESNFANTTIGAWEENGATLSKGGGELILTKTATSGVYGGLELPFIAHASTRYRAKIVYKAILTSKSTDAGVVPFYFEDLHLQIKDGTILKESHLEPIRYAYTQEDIPFFIVTVGVYFKTKDTQIDPRLLVFPDESSPANTTRTLLSVTIERTTSVYGFA